MGMQLKVCRKHSLHSQRSQGKLLPGWNSRWDVIKQITVLFFPGLRDFLGHGLSMVKPGVPGKQKQLVTLLERFVYFLENFLSKEVLKSLEKCNIEDVLAWSQTNSGCNHNRDQLFL